MRRKTQTLSPLPSFSPPIHTLEALTVILSDLKNVKELLPILKRCIAVRILEYSCIQPRMFLCLGSQISKLAITSWLRTDEGCGFVVQLLQAEYWSLRKLKTLEVKAPRSSTAMPSTVARAAIEQECEARGIELIWTDV
ncbi:hypothetical protein BCR35DRAFT_222695 [Leucosporidium creatinivorum]|uniref:F-box domain-containing protein n=1 Tax=Leucosporidium creatinivorum TaxID=106004 RepID=A0A1Y2D936_9BASI|nr:hypothetical protein BCR35DRAFT_222695 [Leucosporidium creatinivorum]